MNDGLDVINTYKDVFGFEICVDDAATAMHVIETEEDLFGDLLDDVHGDALVLMSFDETEQVFAKDFKDHADVNAIGAFVAEMIKK